MAASHHLLLSALAFAVLLLTAAPCAGLLASPLTHQPAASRGSSRLHRLGTGAARRPSSSLAATSTTTCPPRAPETSDRVAAVRGRCAEATAAAAGDVPPAAEWWREALPASPRKVTREEPLRVLIAGGGIAGLVTAAACAAKGMKVGIFEQAGSYSPYGGPIQIQSNALRAIQRIVSFADDENTLFFVLRSLC